MKIKKKNRYILLMLFVFFGTNLSFGNIEYDTLQSKIIKILHKKKYRIVRLNDYSEFTDSIINLKSNDVDKVDYFSFGEKNIGVIYTKNTQTVNVFYEDSNRKEYYLFLLNPLLDFSNNNLSFLDIINNLYSCYYANFNSKEIIYFDLENQKNQKIDIYKIKDDNYFEYIGELKNKIDYPDFILYNKINFKILYKKCKLKLKNKIIYIRPIFIKEFILPLLVSVSD